MTSIPLSCYDTPVSEGPVLNLQVPEFWLVDSYVKISAGFKNDGLIDPGLASFLL